jgi:hypothetical protein
MSRTVHQMRNGKSNPAGCHRESHGRYGWSLDSDHAPSGIRFALLQIEQGYAAVGRVRMPIRLSDHHWPSRLNLFWPL